MKMKTLKKALKNKRYGIPIAFLLVILIGGIFYYIQESYILSQIFVAERENCVLEYGNWECVDGKIAIPFYNAGEKDITFTSVTIPVRNGENIYNVDEPLKSGSTGVLITANCDEIVSENFILKWCCGDKCFVAPMDRPDSNITLMR